MTGRRADSTIMGLQGKVRTVLMKMHGYPPGFSGFLVALPFILQHVKKRKRRECGCWPRKHSELRSILLLKENEFKYLWYMWTIFCCYTGNKI